MDCSIRNHSCNGGLPILALKYVHQHGIATEEEYPYLARDERCKEKDIGNKVKRIRRVRRRESSFFLGMNKTPLSVLVDASNWKFYDPS